MDLTDQTPEIRLAPSFDHASSLGRNEGEERMRRRMNTTDPEFAVAGYAKRAKSALYRSARDKQPLSTLDAFHQAHRRFPTAGSAWLSRLHRLRQKDIRAILEDIPDDFMAPVVREFVMRLLTVNTARLPGVVEKN